MCETALKFATTEHVKDANKRKPPEADTQGIRRSGGDFPMMIRRSHIGRPFAVDYLSASKTRSVIASIEPKPEIERYFGAVGAPDSASFV